MMMPGSVIKTRKALDLYLKSNESIFAGKHLCLCERVSKWEDRVLEVFLAADDFKEAYATTTSNA